MLKGRYCVNGKTLALQGYDIDGVVSLHCICDDKDIDYFDLGLPIEDENLGTENEAYYGANWDYKVIQVKPTQLYVECNETKIDGKKYTSKINKEVFQRLGSIIKGLKDNCTRDKIEGTLAFDDIDYMEEMTYDIDGNKVKLKAGQIVELKYKGKQKGYGEEHGFYNESLELFDSGDSNMRIDIYDKVYAKIGYDKREWKSIEEESDFMSALYGEDVEEDTLYTVDEIIERNKSKNYSWLYTRDYKVVQKDELKDIIEYLKKFDEIGFDTETTGLNINIMSREFHKTDYADLPVGFVISPKEGESYYFPIRHKLFDNICDKDNECEVITDNFKELLETKRIVCHNGEFDWRVGYVYGINTNIKEDTMQLYKVTLWHDHRNMRVALKELTSNFLGRDSLELKDFVKSGRWGSKDIDFTDLPRESVALYACADTDNTLGLLRVAKEKNILDRYGARKTYEIEVAFEKVVGYQKFYGHHVDLGTVDELDNNVNEEIGKLKKEIYELVGYEFNINSSVQMGKVLYEDFQCPVYERTKTGNPSTSKDTLDKLNEFTDENGNKKYPIIDKILKYKESQKLKSDFTSKLVENRPKNGLIFSSITQILETGRLSVDNPNYQSYSNTVKHYIVPRQGYYAADFDFSSIEYRILASMSGEKRLVEAFQSPLTDYHALQAANMNGIPEELVTPSMRQEAKGVNFGLAYGMGNESLGARIYGERTKENTRKAKNLRKRYFQGQDNVLAFMENAKAQGIANSYAETYYGRRRYFDKRKLKDHQIERRAMNHPIQGTAADLYKITCVRLFDDIFRRGYNGKILIDCFIHDEAFMEVHQSIHPGEILEMVRNAADIKPDENWCPLYVGFGYGLHWYQAKKEDIPVDVQVLLLEDWKNNRFLWEGNIIQTIEYINDRTNNFYCDEIIDYIKNKENWEKLPKVHITKYALDILKEIKKGEEGVNLNKVINWGVPPENDSYNGMLKALYEISYHLGILEDFENAKFQDPSKVVVQSKDDMEDEEIELEDIDVDAVTKIMTKKQGVYYDRKDKVVTILNTSQYPVFTKKLKALLKSYASSKIRNPVKIRVLYDDGEIRDTNIVVDRAIKSDIMKMFMYEKRINSGVKGKGVIGGMKAYEV